MITKFKIFERYGVSSVKQDILEQLGENYINDYYMENYDVDIDEIIEIWPDIVKNHIDDEKFVDSWIDDEINNQTIEDFSDWDYKEYIKEYADPEMIEEIVKFYKESQDIKDEDDIVSDMNGKVSIITTKNGKDVITITDENGKVKKYKIPENYSIVVYDGDTITNDTTLATGEKVEYDESMLEDLDEDQLREVIENCNEEDEFVDYVVHKRYDGYDAMEIIDEIYGSVSGKELYKIVQWYLDEDGIIEEYKNNESDEYKEDYILQRLETYTDLYDYLIDQDNKNVLLLADYFVDENLTPDVANEYDFQNKYIEQIVKNHFDETEHDEKEEDEVIADALVFLNENFELNWQIEEEYEDHMWKITSGKYNM